MNMPILIIGKTPETKKEAPRRHNRIPVSRALVIEGEAPETDDELVAEETLTSPPLPVKELCDSITIPQRARVHVDEKLEQAWRKLGRDALTASFRRVHSTMKVVDDMESCLDNTLTTVQCASRHIRHTTAIVYHLEDSVDALLDAAKLIPTRFENTVKVKRLI